MQPPPPAPVAVLKDKANEEEEEEEVEDLEMETDANGRRYIRTVQRLERRHGSTRKRQWKC